MLTSGKKFPDFRLPNQDGIERSLADYKGKWLVMYVYPKDDTPGCTIESKGFTAAKDAYTKEGVVAVGLSADDVDSHKAFCNKFQLAHELLADTSATLLKSMGVGQSEYKGTSYWDRVTMVIDPEGVVRKVYPKVDVNGHEQEVLKDIQSLRS